MCVWQRGQEKKVHLGYSRIFSGYVVGPVALHCPGLFAFCTRAKHFKRRGLLFSFVSLGFCTVPGLWHILRKNAYGLNSEWMNSSQIWLDLFVLIVMPYICKIFRSVSTYIIILAVTVSKLSFSLHFHEWARKNTNKQPIWSWEFNQKKPWHRGLDRNTSYLALGSRSEPQPVRQIWPVDHCCK